MSCISEVLDFQKTLKAIDLPVIHQRDCQEVIKDVLNVKFRVHSSQMCAGGIEAQDTCEGDGGGPLVCELESNPDQFVQVGIISASLAHTSCGQSGVPGIYSSVSNGVCFIKSAIECRVMSNSDCNTLR